MNFQETRGDERVTRRGGKPRERKKERVFEKQTRETDLARETRLDNCRDNGGRVQRGCIISKRDIVMRKAKPSAYLATSSVIENAFVLT